MALISYLIQENPNVEEIRSILSEKMENESLFFLLGHPFAIQLYLQEYDDDIMAFFHQTKDGAKFPLCAIFYKKSFFDRNMDMIDDESKINTISIVKLALEKFEDENAEIYIESAMMCDETKKNRINTLLNEISIAWNHVKNGEF